MFRQHYSRVSYIVFCKDARGQSSMRSRKEEEEEEEGLFKADAVNEEDPGLDRATQV